MNKRTARRLQGALAGTLLLVGLSGGAAAAHNPPQVPVNPINGNMTYMVWANSNCKVGSNVQCGIEAGGSGTAAFGPAATWTHESSMLHLQQKKVAGVWVPDGGPRTISTGVRSVLNPAFRKTTTSVARATMFMYQDNTFRAGPIMVRSQAQKNGFTMATTGWMYFG